VDINPCPEFRAELLRKCSQCGIEKPYTGFYRCKDCRGGRRSQCKACGLVWARKNRRRIQAGRVGERKRLKEEVLTSYGNGVCSCVACGESQLVCLTIDHIDGQGFRHRKEIKRHGISFYRWLRQQGFPKGYQTLCMNCQFVKRAKRKEYSYKD